MNTIALKFIQVHEACRLTAYQDGGGVWTVGWGTTGPDVVQGVVWSQDQADSRLAVKVEEVGLALKKIVRVPLNTEQEAALISLAYNVGVGAVTPSALLRKLNAGQWCPMVREWIDFDHDGGKEVKGLMVRRLDECSLFLKATH